MIKFAKNAGYLVTRTPAYDSWHSMFHVHKLQKASLIHRSCYFKSPSANSLQLDRLERKRVPHQDRQRSNKCTLKSLRKRWKCNRMPRMNSNTKSLLWQGTPVDSWMADPSFGSATPRLSFAFFPGLTLGRFISTKFFKSSVKIPAGTRAGECLILCVTPPLPGAGMF